MTTPPNSPDGAPNLGLLTPREAARWLSISQRALWSEGRAGRIPVVRIGRSTRYDIRDLIAYVDARKGAAE